VRGIVWLVMCGACGRLGFSPEPDPAATDGAPADTSAPPSFIDTFDRADGQAIGNGWTEETPSVFELAGGTVSRGMSATGYDQNLVYRPTTEGVPDVEISIEFTFGDLTGGPDWPQVFVRGSTSPFQGYFAWVTDTNSITLARQVPATWDHLADLALPAFTMTDRYRIRLAARGTNPVSLDLWFEVAAGPGWTVVNEAHPTDATAMQLQGGLIGFGGHTGTTSGPYRYDNFTATDL
jgi:hypothetical protein